jgi:hypothetical protein
MLKREEIQVKVIQRQNQSSEARGGKNWAPNLVIVLNQRKANVKFADVLTSNPLINSVLIPSCVKLPSQRLGGVRRSGGLVNIEDVMPVLLYEDDDDEEVDPVSNVELEVEDKMSLLEWV